MYTRSTILGECPRCGTAIGEGRLLISYEREDGRAAYVECPECLDVVRPE